MSAQVYDKRIDYYPPEAASRTATLALPDKKLLFFSLIITWLILFWFFPNYHSVLIVGAVAALNITAWTYVWRIIIHE